MLHALKNMTFFMRKRQFDCMVDLHTQDLADFHHVACITKIHCVELLGGEGERKEQCSYGGWFCLCGCM